jgi:2-keto-3-deoxy-L-rhamnonate aldolase RhmA
MNKAKDKLRRGGTVLVFNPNFPSPALVEHAGSLGFDVAFIDCEHGSAGFERAEELARAARAAGMTSILRPWSMERGLVTRYLDCGVGGIQFPAIDSAEAAREAVDIVRAARGGGFADTLVAVMIESPAAVANLPAIVAVEGIDAVVVGLADLATSLGHPGDGRHPEVRRAVDDIIRTASRSGGAVAGFNLHHWEEGRELMDKGVRWLTIHAKTLLSRGTKELTGLIGDTAGKAR